MENQDFIKDISLPGEVWKDVVGFEGKYVVSSIGRVAALSFPIEAGTLHYCRRPHLLTTRRISNGYFTTALSCGKNQSRGIYVHRLVATAFIPNPDNLPHINHRDEDKSNNRLENLEWCTVRYNVNYGTAIERRRKTWEQLSHNCKKVAMLDEDGEIIRVYKGLRYAAENIHRNYSAISFAIKHHTKCAGHHWAFV